MGVEEDLNREEEEEDTEEEEGEEIEEVAEEEEEEEDEDEEYFQIDTNDQVKVKQVLDEAIATFVSEYSEDGNEENKKYDVDYKQENYKMIMMTIACAFAVGAQFAPWEFPESRPFLGLCAVGYFILSIYVQYLITVVDGDSILLLKPTPTAPTGIRIRTQFPKAQEYFTILISDNDKSINNGEGNTTFLTFSVGNFFDTKGNFYERGIEAEVYNLCEKFDKKLYNSSEEIEELIHMINGTTPPSKATEKNTTNENKNEIQNNKNVAAAGSNSNSTKKK